MKPTLAALAVPILAATLSASAQAPAPETTPALKTGEKVPAISATAVADGQARSVDYPKGKSTLLLFFNPECPHCVKMIPEWNRAFERKPAKVEVVGLMLAPEPPGFFEMMGIRFPVLRYSGRDAQAKFKMAKIPFMVRVGAGGVVEDVAQGVIDPIRVGELFRP